MKKILSALFLIVSLIPAKAQQFRAGFLGGVSITDVDGMDLVDADDDFKKFGFTLGAYVTSKISESSILGFEIAYAQKGSQIPPDTTNNNAYYKLKLNYINVDLLFRHRININLSKKPTNKFNIEAGLSVGYMFSYSFEVQSITYPLPLRTTDISPFVGFSYDFSDNFGIDLRYYNSVLSIFSVNGTSSPIYGTNFYFLYYGSWNKGHNMDFEITFKYTFGSSNSAITDGPAAPVSMPPKN